MKAARLDGATVWRAAFISDTIAGQAGPPDLPLDDFEHWQKLYESPGSNLFRQRLDQLGTTPEGLFEGRQISGENHAQLSPDWCTLLERGLFSPPVSIPDIADLPFFQLWLPLVGFARSEAFPSPPEHFSQPAILALCRHLLSEICFEAARPVYRLFDRERSRGVSYQDFILRVRNDRYRELFAHFPALARSLNTTVRQWIGNTGAFRDRFNADLAGIESLVGGFACAPEVIAISCGLSERHSDGQQAMQLTFRDNKQVVYKPKNMSLEQLLPAINGWLATEQSTSRFRFPRALEREGYGWAEYIDQRPCGSPEEVHRFFRRAGGLLCLAYFLNATDLQFENLIAHGSEPVLIDLETFFHPELRPLPSAGSPRPADLNGPPCRCVLDTGLLTFWENSRSHLNSDFSGLSGTCGPSHGRSTLHWEAVNSNEMRPGNRPLTTVPGKNQVYYDGALQPPRNFTEDVASGFMELFGFIVAHKGAFLRFVEQFSRAHSRLIFRPSQVYRLLIQRAQAPENLVSGFRQNVSLEQLYRPPLKGRYLLPDLQRIIDHEIQAMLRLDVPRFYVPLDGRSVPDRRGPDFTPLLWEPPVATVQRKIEQSSCEVAEVQCEIIREALTRRSRRVMTAVTRAELTEFALSCRDLVLQRANLHSTPFLWEPPQFGKAPPAPVIERFGLYGGDVGTLLLPAAADFVRGTRLSSETLDKAYANLSSNLLSAGTALGIGCGVGALIYGCLLISRWTHDSRWLDLALQTAAVIPESTIRSHAEPDLLSGQAGLLLALTRLYQSTGQPQSLCKATICLESLAARFRPGVGWIRPNGDACLGFAHGAAGIAFAAATFSAQSGNELGIRLAMQAVQLDRKFYSHEHRNWPVLAASESAFLSAWCSGLPGMLISRIRVAEVSGDPLLREEIERSLADFPSVSGRDFWCCGTLGLAEILAFVANRLHRAELEQKGRELANNVFERAFSVCYFRLGSTIGECYCFQPSLFRGIAGLAYTALRMSSPISLPCLLSFDLP